MSTSVLAFGFCEYKEPESTLRALRLLHDLQIGDKNLLVKVDAKTKAQLDEWKAKKKTTNGVRRALSMIGVLLVSPQTIAFSDACSSSHLCFNQVVVIVNKLSTLFPCRIRKLKMEETTRKRF